MVCSVHSRVHFKTLKFYLSLVVFWDNYPTVPSEMSLSHIYG